MPNRFTTLELGSPTELGPRSQAVETRQFTVYPNPSPNGSSHLALSGFDEHARVQVTNMKGQVAYRNTHTGPHVTLKHFPSGLYVVQVSDVRGTLTKQLLVQ